MADLAVLVSHVSNLARLSPEKVADYCAALARARYPQAIGSIREASGACGIASVEGLGIHAAFLVLHYGPTILTAGRADFYHFYGRHIPQESPRFNTRAINIGQPVKENKLRGMLICSRQRNPVFYGEIVRNCQSICDLPTQVVAAYFEALRACRPPFLFADISAKAGISHAAGLGIQLAFFIGWFGMRLITSPLRKYCTVYERKELKRPMVMHRRYGQEDGPTTLGQVVAASGDEIFRITPCRKGPVAGGEAANTGWGNERVPQGEAIAEAARMAGKSPEILEPAGTGAAPEVAGAAQGDCLEACHE